MVLDLLIQIRLLAPFLWLGREQVNDRTLVVGRPICVSQVGSSAFEFDETRRYGVDTYAQDSCALGLWWLI